MKIHVQLDASPDQAVVRATELAAAGVDGIFSFEGPHDVFLSLALATQATGLPVMTNVAIALPRSPLHLAHAAHDLQLLSGGRFRLGLGSQVKTHIERRYGATWSRPAARMREIVGATRTILRAWDERRQPSYRGEFTRHDFMPPLFMPEPLPWGPPPVLMGALGPLMTHTAGEVADGLLAMPFNSRQHLLARALPALEQGIAAAGRSRDDVTVIPQVITAVGTTDQELERAVAGARSLVAFYASTPAYRPVLDEHGWGELQPRLHELMVRGDVAAMSAAIDDEVFDTIAVRGAPEECARLIKAKFDGIGTEACVYFPGMRHSPETLGALVAALHTT